MNRTLKLGVHQAAIYRMVDVGAMIAAFTIGAILGSPGQSISSLADFMSVRVSLGNLLLFAVFVAVWLGVFVSFRLYDQVGTRLTARETLDVLKASSLGTCLIVAAAVPFDISFVDARFLLVLWVGTTVLSIGARISLRALLRRVARARSSLRKVVIVGVNPKSLRLAQFLAANPDLGFKVLGFVDDPHNVTPGFAARGFALVAGKSEFFRYLGRTAVDEVLICLPEDSSSDEVKRFITDCEVQGVMVGILRDLFPWRLDYSRILQIEDQTIISVYPHAMVGGRAALKRAIDIIVGAALLLLLAPLLILIAALVKFSSPGPVFFAQERVGINKQHFRMLKFRTMVADAEQHQAELETMNEAAGPAFKIKQDPRVTPVGRFLRRASLDELPQLINVLRGEMSLVGPRPLPLRDYNGFSQDWHRRRVSVRPGMTGLWQVYSRDHSAFDEWMRLDLQYIDQWSLALDLKLLLRTLPVMLKGSGH